MGLRRRRSRISMYSLKRFTRSWGFQSFMPVILWPISPWPPVPIPSSRRPFDMWSTVSACLASQAGLRQGMAVTRVPILILDKIQKKFPYCYKELMKNKHFDNVIEEYFLNLEEDPDFDYIQNRIVQMIDLYC